MNVCAESAVEQEELKTWCDGPLEGNFYSKCDSLQ